jgi:hypothetical protein
MAEDRRVDVLLFGECAGEKLKGHPGHNVKVQGIILARLVKNGNPFFTT